MTILCSPAEPPALRGIGDVSPVPETLGADFAWQTPGGWVGVQRKELRDLVASLTDGRLSQELGQLQSCVTRMLIVEGKPRWAADGTLADRYRKTPTRQQWCGLLWTVRARGVWVQHAATMAETAEIVGWFHAWTQKPKHTSLEGRPAANAPWGHRSSRLWGVHFLTGLPGVGPETAGALFDAKGKVPLQWEIGIDEMLQIPGVGKVRAKRLLAALADNESGNDGGH